MLPPLSRAKEFGSGVSLAIFLELIQRLPPSSSTTRRRSNCARTLCFTIGASTSRQGNHFIRGCIEEGKISVDYVNTNGQLADILTKALPRAKFEELRERIGMIQVKGN